MIVVEADVPGRLAVRFPFDRAVITAVKGVPTARWNPTNKVWTVLPDMAVALRVALRGWDDDVLWLGIDRPDFPSAKPGAATGDWATNLFAAVGPSRADTVFRALARVLHPDAPTGDGALMRELLEARETRHRAA